jgi:hypothetical protein
MRARHEDQIFIYIRFEGIPESLEDQYVKLDRIAGAHQFVDCAGDVWMERQKLFVNAGNSVICKCSVLPSQIGSLCDAIFQHTRKAGVVVTLVAQGTGLAEVRLDAADLHLLTSALRALRYAPCAVRSNASPGQ